MMQRRYSAIRVWAVLLSSVALSAGCGDPEVRKQEAFEKGRQLYEKGEVRSAVLEFRNAIQLDPAFADARYWLGKCFLKQQNAAAAVVELQKAKDAKLEPEPADLDRCIAEALVGSGQYEEGRLRCAALLEKDPKDAVVLASLSEALIGLGEQAYTGVTDNESRAAAKKLVDEAKAAAETALAEDAGLVEPHMTLARALVSERLGAVRPEPLSESDTAEIEGHLEAARKARPDDANLRHRMVRLWRWAGNREKAMNEVAAILAATPEDPDAQLLKAELLFDKGEVDEAAALAQSLVEREISSPRLDLLVGRSWFAKGEAANARGGKDEARAAFEKARDELRKVKDNPAGGYLFGVCLDRLGDQQQARGQLDQVLGQVPAHEGARRALFEMYMRENNLDRAAVEADEAVRVAPLSPAGYMLQAKVHSAQKDWTKAREAVNRALELAPDSIEALLLLANTHRNEGALSECAAAIDRLVKAHPEDAIGYVVRSEVSLEQRQFEAAETDARRAAELVPGDSRPLVTIARSRIAKGDLDGAVAAYEEALRAAPDSAPVRLAFAGLRAARKEFQEGIVLLEAVPEADPSYVQARRRIAEMYDAMGKPDAAAAEFEKLMASHPEAEDATVGLFKHNWRAQEFAENEQLARDTLARDPKNPLGHLMLSDLYAGRRLWPQAADAMKAAVELQPDSPRLLFRLGALCVNAGRLEDAMEAFQRARDLEPDFDAATLGAAKTLVALGRAEEGAELCAEVAQRKPDDPNVLLAMADIKAAQRQTAEAEELYSKVIGSHPEFLLPYLRLAALCEQNGRADDALAVYEKAIAAVPDAPDMYVQYGRFQERQGDKEAAQRQYLRALDLAPDSPQIQDIVARGSLEAGDYGDAEKRLRSRIEQAPDDVAARLNLALVLEKQGRAGEATQSLVDFVRASDNPEAAGMGLSQVLARNRNYDEVERLATSLLGADAKSWVAHYALGVAKAGQDDLEAARGHFVQAAELNANTPILRHAEGAALAQMEKDGEALRAFEAALVIDGKFIPAYLDAAQVCLRMKDFEKAEAFCVQAAQADPEHAGPPILLGLVQARSGRAQEALDTISGLLERQPQSAIQASMVVDALKADGKYNDAIAVCKKCLDAASDNPILVMKLGSLYQQAGDLGNAAAEYERLTKLAPNAAASYNNLACILVEQGKIDEAMPHALRARELAPNHPGIADTLGWTLFKKGNTAEAIPLLEAAAEGMPEAPEILYHLAKAYVQDGRKDEARGLLTKALGLSAAFSGSGDARTTLESLGPAAVR